MASDSNRTQALFDKLQRISRRSSGAKPETVHQFRTTIRRVETLLATTSAHPWSEGTEAPQAARRGCGAAPARFATWMYRSEPWAACGWSRSPATGRGSWRSWRRRAPSGKSKLLLAFQNEVDGGLHKRLGRTATRLQQEFPKPAQRDADEQRFLAAALDKFAAVVKQHPALSEGNLHDFRMGCKRVRYLAEMAGEGPKVAAVIEQLKRIQDSVGSWHDWLTLTATAESVLSPSGQVPLLSALRASTRSKYLEALRITADAKRALLEMHESQRTHGKPVSRSAPVAASPAARAATA